MWAMSHRGSIGCSRSQQPKEAVVTRVKYAIYAASLALAMILPTLVANQPASAATWITDRNIAIGISHSGRHVSTVTVEEFPSPGIPVNLTLHYTGCSKSGVLKGPQKSITFTCTG